MCLCASLFLPFVRLGTVRPCRLGVGFRTSRPRRGARCWPGAASQLCELIRECRCPTLSLNCPLCIDFRLRASNSWRLCIDNNGGRRGTRVTTGQIGLPLPSLWTCPCQMACLCVPAFSYHRRPNAVHTGNFRVLLQHAVNDTVRISHHAP